MLAEDVQWQVLRNYAIVDGIMVALFRRRTRLLAILATVVVVYLLIIFVPKRPDTLYGFAYVHSSYDWSRHPQKYPAPAPIKQLPTGNRRTLPKIQYAFETDTSPESVAREQVLAERRLDVKQKFLKGWDSYRNKAWMHDELTPVSGGWKDGYGGWGATLVDSLDMLWIMGLKDEFYDAVAAAMTIDWAKTDDKSFNVFETTIRYLGALLAAYDLSKEPAILLKAIELGDMLYMAFDTPNRMPVFWMNFEEARNGELEAGNHVPSAAVASLGVEFTRLAQITGDDKYYDAIDRVTQLLDSWQNRTSLPGMWPTFFDMRSMQLDMDQSYTLGALSDSLYEYLPKMYFILGGLEPMYEKLYRDAMDTAVKSLLFRPMTPSQDDILFSGSAYATADIFHLVSESQHLGCFAGGMFGMAGKLFGIAEHVSIAEKITRGCVWAYDAMETGVGPEVFNIMECHSLEPCEWDNDRWLREGNLSLKKGFKDARDPRYLLRPEAIESVFFMYRITGDQEYQEIAWRMYQSIVKAAETDLAFASVEDVTVTGETDKADSMESFWLSETLKYFYLIFSSPDLISLDQYVFNTEAHPLLRP
ncbi:hypothetical protein DL766_008253 [Monosporascus sp. MC13-8B]|uniref:alpha-1,2-Mannosidase n=1 Tax=Monosporascus cannonballus TaxID=155416 RepID=A0ABY0HCD2_9PEZI|nr:hypothetical protein DL763_010888 [Monosporascus cannonballus]RYO89371.1 hypothetical protein DL762_003262 [Monosporascus cannonballus]RYP20156.1 hypothetical protein DL766_008253 [Monosporascus sp. MC13-8B]